jgi:glutathione S-transferase
MLKVWGRRNAFNVQKVLWLVGELGLAHEHINAGGSFAGLDSPDFLTMNPHGKIPVIDDDGTIVWESHCIIRYLSARYSAGTLWATTPSERSLADRWMDWSLATLQPDFMRLFWGYYRTPEGQRDLSAVATATQRCASAYQLLDGHLETHRYLAGDRLTMGDIPAGTSLYRYFLLDVARPALPHVEAWYDRLKERPAYREHVMLPFADLRGRLEY